MGRVSAGDAKAMGTQMFSRSLTVSLFSASGESNIVGAIHGERDGIKGGGSQWSDMGCFGILPMFCSWRARLRLKWHSAAALEITLPYGTRREHCNINQITTTSGGLVIGLMAR